MVELLAYIKNLLFAPDWHPSEEIKKRKVCQEEFYTPNTSKRPRISSSSMANSPDGEGRHSPYNLQWRSSSRNSSFNKAKPNSSKENVTLVIDDEDDDVIEISKPKPANKFCSTPNLTISPRSSIHRNGDDDITLLKYTKSSDDKKFRAKKQGFDYLKPYSYLTDNQNKGQVQNKYKRRDFTSPILSSLRNIKSKMNMSKPYSPTIRSTALDQSFRLDEKMKYKQLLAQAAPNCSSALRDSFSKYSTPIGKIFTHSPTRRSKKLTEMALNNNKPIDFVDLTLNGSNGIQRKHVSTKETIKKVLDEFPIEPIIIKDSDSDIEMLPRPPSPKPDIKIEPINSIKKIVDTSEQTHTSWLNQMIERHKSNVARYDRDIRNQIAQKKKLSEVTSEIQAHRLEDQMEKCLKIKDVVLPVRFEENAFPELSDDDEFRIDCALKVGKNNPPTDVLAQKFSLNITREDIQTLDGLNWLNDEVINFYMNLVIERGKDSRWPNAYAMNTFFYPKLLKDGHSSLRRWTRRVDIFFYDIIAVPIHLGMHWCMSIIDFRNRSIKYYDSMGRSNKRCLEALRNYLKAEHLDKKQKEYDMSKWLLESVADIPQQMNGSDCGVFSCTYAEFLTRNGELSFGQENMPYLRRKMILEILNGELLVK